MNYSRWQNLHCSVCCACLPLGMESRNHKPTPGEVLFTPSGVESKLLTMLMKYYRRFFEVGDRFSDKVITVRIIFFLILIGMVIWLAAELYQEMERKQVITPCV